MRILGVDIGGSSTKMAEVEDGRILFMAGAPSSIPLDDLFDRDGQCVKCPDMDLRRVDRIVLTGAGSTSVKGSLRCLPTMSTDEFEANACGARFLAGLDSCVVVSIGTGTSFVKVDGPRYAHLGGLAIGGGTFSGLSNSPTQQLQWFSSSNLSFKSTVSSNDSILALFFFFEDTTV